ncbi:MAG: N-acetylglucosamine kinase [Acutalibacteraceae bacterium]
MDCYIGIDGGGSKTLLQAATADGGVLFEGLAGGSNPYTATPAAAEQVVRGLIEKAKNALPSDAVLKGVCMGAAGPDKEEDFLFFEQILRDASGCDNVKVVNDGYASLYAVLGERPGVVIASGTGSICWAKNADGTVCRVGGWGHLFSDEGSGYAMVSDAMRAVCRTIDGRASQGTLLLQRLMDAFGVQTPLELISEIYLCPNQQAIAAYFPLVSKAAEERDPLALKVVDDGMDALVELVASAARQVMLYHTFSVGMTGAVLTKVELTRHLFIHKLLERFPRCEIIHEKTESVSGALYLAQHI